MQQGCLSKLQDLPYLPGIDKDILARSSVYFILVHQGELERLNKASEEINKLELELDVSVKFVFYN